MVWITHLISLTLTFPTSKRSVAERGWLSHLLIKFDFVVWVGSSAPVMVYSRWGSVVECGWIVAFCYTAGVHATHWMLRAVECNLGGRDLLIFQVVWRPNHSHVGIKWPCETEPANSREASSPLTTKPQCWYAFLFFMGLNDRLSWVPVAVLQWGVVFLLHVIISAVALVF